MFYKTAENDHGLAFNPFKACVVPRPIGWISSQNKDGHTNLAPFSYFNAIADRPAMIMFSVGGKHTDGRIKDTLCNVEETKEFVVNMATWDLREQVNLSSSDFPAEISEIEQTQLTPIPSVLVKPPRIKESPIHLECIHHQSIDLPVLKENHFNRMVLAKVVGVHIQDDVMVNGKVDATKFKPIARLGYMEYAVITETFVMERPYYSRSE